MVAAGNHVHPRGEDFLSGLGRDAGTTGGILAVGNHNVQVVPLAELRNKVFDGATTRFTHNVGDEKKLHERHGSRTPEI